MNDNLIYDVGMHKGYDAENYLKAGYKVIGIEASPDLAQCARERLADYESSGQLVICPVAIADHAGETTFYANKEHDDWGSTSETFVALTNAIGTTNIPVTVPCVTFQSILAKYGVPYYLKIDIEGSDLLCVEALKDFADRPQYVSIEIREESRKGLDLLRELGYRKFKIVDQAPFDGIASGPFGEELPGKWLRFMASRAFKKALKDQSTWYDLHCKRLNT
jgi:FkbM family methyltransferase